jgi:DNA-binding NarL/FixJ family response regulator
VTGVRVLVVEDQGVAADMAVAELAKTMSCDVVIAAGPMEAIARLSAGAVDVAVIDMLFLSHSNEFESRRRRGQVRLTDAWLHLSGLAVLRAVQRLGLATRTVLWSSGEPNRRLHMMFAYEALNCRVMCSKHAVANLPHAVRSALDGREYIDPVLDMHLRPAFSKSLRETILTSRTRLAVWRAMALGQHQHKAIAKLANVEPGTVRKGMDEMRSALLEFDPGCVADGSPSAELIRYASQNWEFFLDDTVREMYP